MKELCMDIQVGVEYIQLAFIGNSHHWGYLCTCTARHTVCSCQVYSICQLMFWPTINLPLEYYLQTTKCHRILRNSVFNTCEHSLLFIEVDIIVLLKTHIWHLPYCTCIRSRSAPCIRTMGKKTMNSSKRLSYHIRSDSVRQLF